MAFPTTTVHLVAHFDYFDGQAATGFLSFQPTKNLTDVTDGFKICAQEFELALDDKGTLEVDLLATDTANLLPSWQWIITEKLTDRPQRKITVSLPSTTPTVNYSDLV